jgi:hypothetical protein
VYGPDRQRVSRSYWTQKPLSSGSFMTVHLSVYGPTVRVLASTSRAPSPTSRCTSASLSAALRSRWMGIVVVGVLELAPIGG